ncbi:hypothetical protein SO802_021420 [Lithocarpus litseifolius]|uniref:Uncharacterized protein n=1 Tax=Lithocarpus litseifolius TaxID=425828 RepID=A0AAW2CHR3_9ROSI
MMNTSMASLRSFSARFVVALLSQPSLKSKIRTPVVILSNIPTKAPRLSTYLRPLYSPFQFSVQAIDIYTTYKVSVFLQVFQVRVSFVKDVQKQEARWERQHELVAENFGFYRLYSVLLVEAIGLAW